MMKEPAWPLPTLGPLHRVAIVDARCGPPESPMTVQSTILRSDAGARAIVLSYGGKPRKYLYDLNADSLVDLEMWDASGSGRFDAEREARYPIPSFLLPPPGPPPFNPAVFAGLTPDSMARLYAFRGAGVYRPQGSPNMYSPTGPFQGAGGYTPRAAQPSPGTGPTPVGPTAATRPAPATPARPRGPHLLGRPIQLPRPNRSR